MSSPNIYAQDCSESSMNLNTPELSLFPSQTPFSPMRSDYVDKPERPAAQPVAEPSDVSTVPKSLKAVFVHAVRHGVRSFMLGYGLRTLFSVLLRVFSLARSAPRALLDLDQLLGERNVRVRVTAVRLGLSLGVYSFLFRLVNGLLRMALVQGASDPQTGSALPRPNSLRRSITSISNSLHHLASKLSPVAPEDTPVRPQFWVPEGLITGVAGAVAGLSVLFQPQDTHRTLALYLFARALQCGFNHLVKHGLASPLPFCAEGLFALSSGVAMYCYTLRPDSIAPAFFSFISKAGPIDSRVLHSVHMLGAGLSHDGAGIRENTRTKFGIGMRLFNWRFPNFGSCTRRRRNHLNLPLSVPDHVWTESQQAFLSRCKPLPPASALAYDMDGNPSTPFSTVQASSLYTDGSQYHNERDYGASMGFSSKDMDSVESGPLLSNLEQYLQQRGLQPCPTVRSVAPTAPLNIAKQVLNTKLEPKWSWCVEQVEHQKELDMRQGFVEASTPPSTDAGLLPYFEDDHAQAGTLTPANKALLVETLLHTHLGSPAPTPSARQVVRAVQEASLSEGERKVLRLPAQLNPALQHQHAAHLTRAVHEKLGLAVPVAPLALSSEARQHIFTPPNSCLAQNHRLPCFLLHPAVPHSCSANAARVFLETGAKVLPLYASLSIVPLVVMKHVALLTNPAILLGTVASIIRSCAFLGTFTSVYQSVVCMHRRITPTGPESSFTMFFAGVCAGAASIMVENESRRTELALYVLPRALDCLVSLSRNSGLLWGPVFGSLLIENLFIWCSSLGVITYCFHHHPDTISRLPKSILSY